MKESLYDLIGQVATITGVNEPVEIGKFTARRNPLEVKNCLARMNQFNFLNFPYPSLQSINDLMGLNNNIKTLCDIILEIASKESINPSESSYDNLPEDTAIFFYWYLFEFTASNGYTKKPVIYKRDKLKIESIPHFKMRYYCPFGCYHHMAINQNVESNDLKSQLWILWFLDHLKNFHKVEFNLLDNFLAIDSIPDIFLKLGENGGRDILPPVKKLTGNCPKCKESDINLINESIALCQNVQCSHVDSIENFKV